MNVFLKGGALAAGMLATAATVAAYQSTTWSQIGAPGVAMEQFDTNERLAQKVADNVVPKSLPPASPDGPRSVDMYKNVQVLGHLSVGEMSRLMASMTTWVAPSKGCAYCHAPLKGPDGALVKDAQGNLVADPNNMHSDEVYAKVVARRMLQMTWHINEKWQPHVKETGVTCYTCHRGQPVPQNLFYDEVPNKQSARLVGDDAGQNAPAAHNGYGLTSLPRGALSSFLVDNEEIRVIGTEALPHDNRHSIKQAEHTYALMMHMSTSLGVNCTHCHNSRSMAEWNTSPKTRAAAWYGIRMARDLNNTYVLPLGSVLPKERMGPMGDAPKLACNTCHAGAYKPLLGVSMLKDYPELQKAQPQPAKTIPAETPTDQAPVDTPESRGKGLWASKGCLACHTLDGSTGVGPSWLGLYGRTSKFADGQALADDAYIAESIRAPQAKVVAGYPPVMPPFALSDAEVADLIAFIKTLKP
jgi:photosynthetic reaction center cytochrome c subunit